MPCMGPIPRSPEQIEKIRDDILQLLKEKYSVTGPIKGMFGYTRFVEEWNEKLNGFTKSLEEVVWLDDMYSF